MLSWVRGGTTAGTQPHANIVNSFYPGTSGIGDPVAVRGVKYGVEFALRGNLNNASGRIFVLITDTTIAVANDMTSTTGLNNDAVFDSIAAHPHSKSFTPMDFAKKRLFFSTPRDAEQYWKWLPYSGTGSATTWINALTDREGATSLDPDVITQPFKYLYVAIETADSESSNFTLDLRVHDHRYLRYHSTSFAAAQHKPLPTAPASAFNAAMRAAELVGAAGFALGDAAGALAYRAPAAAEILL